MVYIAILIIALAALGFQHGVFGLTATALAMFLILILANRLDRAHNQQRADE